jgi:hypothetical protein
LEKQSFKTAASPESAFALTVAILSEHRPTNTCIVVSTKPGWKEMTISIKKKKKKKGKRETQLK